MCEATSCQDKPHPLLHAYHQWIRSLVEVDATAVKLGLEARRVEISEHTLNVLERAFERFASELGASWADSRTQAAAARALASVIDVKEVAQ